MTMRTSSQRGFLLIEALVAILIFSLGVLGMVAMGSAAVATQSDARYRTDAASLADEIAGTIAFSVDRTSATTIATSVARFAYQPVGDPTTTCAFSGGGTIDPVVQNWLSTAVQAGTRRLPNDQEQIVVTPSTTAGGQNRVQITVCWKGPSDLGPRHHTLVTYVN